MPGSSYADVFSAFRVSWDAALLDNYFTRTPPGAWTLEQKRATTGFGDYASVLNPGGVPEHVRTLKPRGFCFSDIDPQLLYDPVANPTGIRCDIFSAYANVFGTDPSTGFVRRPFDNVGVQYGLGALNSGAITAAQFVDLNANIGGFDVDGEVAPARSVGDSKAVRRAHRTGRIIDGGGGLASMPIIDYRSYSDTGVPGGDHHQRFYSFAMRERMIEANGHARNHVMLVERLRTAAGAPILYAPLQSGLLVWAVEQMDVWLTNLVADTSDKPRIQKIEDARPPALADGCHRPSRPALPFVIQGPDVVHDPLDPSRDCNQLYPVYSFPRGVAGQDITNDIIQCRLKPLDWSDYTTVGPEDVALLQAELPKIFPTGVCDNSKRGRHQPKRLDTWLEFGTE